MGTMRRDRGTTHPSLDDGEEAELRFQMAMARARLRRVGGRVRE
jgi:hypothetical protein